MLNAWWEGIIKCFEPENGIHTCQEIITKFASLTGLLQFNLEVKKKKLLTLNVTSKMTPPPKMFVDLEAKSVLKTKSFCDY